MALFDQHLHTKYSDDSLAEPEANVLAAIERGLDGITFTDHFDTEPTEWPRCRYDYDRLHEAVLSLRATYGHRLFIGHGIEVCFQPARLDFILDYLASHAFDLVILSVHWFEGRALHHREHWRGVDAYRGTQRYLETVLEAAKTAGALRRDGQRAFDVLGHIDLVKRYTRRYFDVVDVAPYRDLVDEILRAAIASDIVPEINMSTTRQGVGEPAPAEWVIRRYAELGGTMMTLGSDAHTAEHIGAGLTEATEILRRNGITQQAVFRARRREAVPLPS
jgi:histidinol-phosphatase (PHP family)